MPKHLTYRYKNQLIPADQLVLTEARKCPFTGKLFDSDVKYNKHLKKVRTMNRLKRSLANSDQMVDQVRNMSIKQALRWIENNGHILFFNCTGVMIEPGQYQIKILEINGKYDKNASNSHSCPRNGVTNFDTRRAAPGTPTGYPGYVGRIRFSYSEISKELYSKIDRFFVETRILKHVGIHTGSGGSSNNIGKYDFKMFLDDWPGLARETTLKMLSEPSGNPAIRYETNT